MSEIENIVDYLKRYGIKSKIVKEADVSDVEKRSLEVIQLTGRSISEIELKKGQHSGDKGIGFNDRIHFRITYDESPKDGSRQATIARTKVVMGKKFLGMFGQKVVDVQWVGDRHIENALNQDIDLRMMLIDPSCKPEYRDIAIFPSSNPWGLEAVDIASQLEPSVQFNFQVYDRIAKHVRNVISAF